MNKGVIRFKRNKNLLLTTRPITYEATYCTSILSRTREIESACLENGLIHHVKMRDNGVLVSGQTSKFRSIHTYIRVKVENRCSKFWKLITPVWRNRKSIGDMYCVVHNNWGWGDGFLISNPKHHQRKRQQSTGLQPGKTPIIEKMGHY